MGFQFHQGCRRKLFGHRMLGRLQAAAADDQPQGKAGRSQPPGWRRNPGLHRSAGDLTITGLVVTFDATSSTVSIFGVAADQATKEETLLCCGNVSGVSNVNDNMSVDQSETGSHYHDVVRGDTLWAIAKAAYGDGNKYPVIFETNKPMLSHPDKIYPGQKLRIPPL